MTSSNSGSCTICAQRNPYSNSACEGCGARLPWVNATALRQPDSPEAGVAKKILLNPWIQIASFLLPILGIALYFAYRTSNPGKAKSAIQAAAWGMALNLVLLFAGK